jgi:hypothetical protein
MVIVHFLMGDVWRENALFKHVFALGYSGDQVVKAPFNGPVGLVGVVEVVLKGLVLHDGGVVLSEHALGGLDGFHCLNIVNKH